MSNYILLCHGGLKEFSSFQLQAKQSVQYRGKYGTDLSSSVAKALVQALLSNPCVSDADIATQVKGYVGQDPLKAGKTYAPDINLKGDDHLLCFLMKMEGHRPWIRLDNGFSSTLSKVVASLGAPLWLNLLCCTDLASLDAAPAIVKDGLEVKSWGDILHA